MMADHNHVVVVTVFAMKIEIDSGYKYDFAGHLQFACPEGGREGGAVELGEGEGRLGRVARRRQEPEGEGAGDDRNYGGIH